MAPRESRKSQPAVESESEEESQPVSTEQAAASMMTTAAEIVANARKRREDRRKEIEDNHAKRVKEVKGKIQKQYAARTGKATKYQKELWIRLETLNAKRENIEQLILTSMKSIEKHTLNIASEVDAILQGRMEEIKAEDEEGSSKTT